MKIGHFYIADDRKKYCPQCGNPMKDISNVADKVYFCKKCGATTYNSLKYEAEFIERGSIKIKHVK